MKLVTFLLWGLIAILVFPISCFCAFLWILFSCCSPCFAECGAVLEAMWKGTTSPSPPVALLCPHALHAPFHLLINLKYKLNNYYFVGTTLVQYCCIKAMGGEPGAGGKGKGGGH
jgi:hypothetical protein